MSCLSDGCCWTWVVVDVDDEDDVIVFIDDVEVAVVATLGFAFFLKTVIHILPRIFLNKSMTSLVFIPSTLSSFTYKQKNKNKQIWQFKHF